MSKLPQFFRVERVDYKIEDQNTCLPVTISDCPVDEHYEMPGQVGDVVSFQIDKSDAFYNGAQVADLRIGLSQCGVLVYPNIGSFTELTNKIQVTATLPNGANGCYEFLIYTIYDPIDCGMFAGFTLQQVIDSGVTLGQVLGCTLNDFL